MTIRQQYANEELVHKLRSMLHDLPTLRTRAIKKLEHWREAAIKRLLARQRELEKTLLDKFERLEFDTQLFVEKTERKKAQQQRRWQSEPLDYLNKNEIDRISTNLRSIREELEQSKIILVGNNTNENVAEIVSNDHSQHKLTETAPYEENTSTKADLDKSYDATATTNELGLELKRVLEICTSPQCPSASLSTDEQSRSQSLNHAEYSYDANSKQTTAKTSTTYEKNPVDQTNNNINRRHARLITNISEDQDQIKKQPEYIHNELPVQISHKIIGFDSFDDSIRRFQRLREIRKNLRTKYDEHSPRDIKMDEDINRHSNDVLMNKPTSPDRTNPDIVQLYDQAANSIKARERKYRSRTLDSNQISAVDNHIYGCASSRTKPQSHQRSESHKHRSQRLSFRRSSEDFQDKKFPLRRHLNATYDNANELWFEVEKEHWTNLLENGWRPTADTPGVHLVSFADSDNDGSHKRKPDNSNTQIIDLYDKLSRHEYVSLFDRLDFAYARTIDLGNEFWRFLEIDGDHHLCLYHQLNKQFILYKPDISLLSFPWPFDGIVDISWSKLNHKWAVATQTQIIICNRSFSKVLESIDIGGDWPKRITTCRSSIFHTYKISGPSTTSSTLNTSYNHVSYKDRPQFLLERYDYKLNSLCKHILESSTIWDIEADDLTEHLAVLCDVALLIFDYQLNLLRQIEATGFKVSTDYFGGWLIADYNASCIWQIRRNEYLKANKILTVERPWAVILDRSTWTLITLSETQNRAKRLLFFNLNNIPTSLMFNDSLFTQSHISISPLSSTTESIL